MLWCKVAMREYSGAKSVLIQSLYLTGSPSNGRHTPVDWHNQEAPGAACWGPLFGSGQQHVNWAHLTI